MEDTRLAHSPSAPGLEDQQVHTVELLIGSRIRERRLSRGLSQQQLGLMTGVTLQQVYKYERGLNKISVGRLFTIAAALDVPTHWFFEGIDGLSADPEESRWKARSLEIARIFSALEGEKLRHILSAMVEALASLGEELIQSQPINSNSVMDNSEGGHRDLRE
jgi:transcriptional regulator with XRE-family HTH domain